MQSDRAELSRPPLGAIIWGIFLNATIPVILYELARRYVSTSEFTALAIAAIFPIGKSIFELVLRGQLDPIAILVLLGILTDAAALTLGGSPSLLLIRESYFTGAFGIACFVSLMFPRPVMFYFARHFMAGNDPVRQARFNSAWRFPEVRFCHRLITIVWGCAFVGELGARIILIRSVSTATVLIVSAIMIGSLTIATMVWAFSYGYRVRLRATAKLA